MLIQIQNSSRVSCRANMREETAFTVQCVIERKRLLLHVGRVSSYELNTPPALSIPAHIQGFVCVCNVYGLWISPWQQLGSGMAQLVTMSRLDGLLSKIMVRRKKEQIECCKMMEWEKRLAEGKIIRHKWLCPAVR